MHIEPGVLDAVKVTSANAAALAALGAYTPSLIKRPVEVVKVGLAAAFFSLFMELYHAPVGPSELHFIGASAVYFTFGFLPTLFGFAIGLLLQGILFEPQDLMHLGVNSLSLIVPLIAVHETVAKRFFVDGETKASVTWRRIMAFDAAYYTGVVTMVGFWLLLGDDATPLADWALFAAAYLPLVLCEPAFTWMVLKGVDRLTTDNPVRRATVVDRLALG